MKYLLIAGRLLFAFLFIASSTGLFKPETAAYAAAHGVPFASLMVPLAGITELVGGLMLLIGYKARFGAALLVLFLLPVTLMLHQFWKIADPMAQQAEMASFMKNISLAGAALMLTYLGSGPLSVDTYLASKKK